MARRSSQPPIVRLNPSTFAARHAQQQRPPGQAAAQGNLIDQLYRPAIGALVLAAVCYNTFLAMAGAVGIGIGASSVIICESAILALALLMVLKVPFGKDDMPSIAMLAVCFVLTIYITMMNGVFVPDTMRNGAIMAVFAMLGVRMDFRWLNITFLVITGLVLAVLLLEMFDLKTYVSTFQPAQYFSKTRGLPIPYWDKSGLFSNALGFKDRFSFGVTAHRTSSLFLEQVSNANYAAFVIILLLALWNRLPALHRLLYVGTVIMILITTSTRTSLVLACIAPLGYFIYPHLPRYMNAMLAPLFVVIAFVVGDYTVRGLMEDSFVGRLSLTASTLYRMEFATAMGENVEMAKHYMDSGYTWVIYMGSFVAVIAIWTFISCYVPQRSISQKRCAYGISLYAASSLLVGGTAFFTIKTATCIWLLAGFMRAHGEDVDTVEVAVDEEPVASGPPKPAPSSGPMLGQPNRPPLGLAALQRN